MHHYGDIAFTAAVRERQVHDGSRVHYAAMEDLQPPEALGEHEREFIAAANSFYLGTVNSDGWPYIQHRGGEVGFARVIDDRTIGWLERNGNRQYVTAGNLDTNDKVSLFIMDYPTRTRLKLLGRATRIDTPDDALVEQLGGGRNTGAVIVRVEAFDWNCPKYITPRFDEETIKAAMAPLHERIRELEAQLADAARTSAS